VSRRKSIPFEPFILYYFSLKQGGGTGGKMLSDYGDFSDMPFWDFCGVYGGRSGEGGYLNLSLEFGVLSHCEKIIFKQIMLNIHSTV